MCVIMTMASILYNLENSSSDVNLRLSELEYSQWSLKKAVTRHYIIHIMQINKIYKKVLKNINKLNQ